MKEVIFLYLDYVTKDAKLYKGERGSGEGYYLIDLDKNEWYFDSDDLLFFHFSQSIYRDISTIYNLSEMDSLDIIKSWIKNKFDLDINSIGVSKPPLDKFSNPIKMEELIKGLKEIPVSGSLNESIKDESRMKPIIFQYLDYATRGGVLYEHPYEEDMFFLINPKTKEWYFDLDRTYHIYFSYKIFNEINFLYSIWEPELLNLIKKWIKLRFNLDSVTINLNKPVVDVINLVLKHDKTNSDETINENVDEIGDRSQLKELVFYYLNHITKGSKVYGYNNGLWIINPKTKYWYFERLDRNSVCTVRENTLDELTNVFNLIRSDLLDIMGEWSETIFSEKISELDFDDTPHFDYVNDVIDNGVEIKTLGHEVKNIYENVNNNEKLKEIIFQYLNYITDGYNLYDEGNGRFWITNPNDEWCIFLGDTHYGQVATEFIEPICSMFNTPLEVCTESIKQWMENFFSRKLKKVSNLPERYNRQVINSVINRLRIKPIKIMKQNKEIKSLNDNKLQEMKETIKKAIDTEFTKAASEMGSDSFIEMQRKSNNLQGQLEGETTEATSAGSAGGYSGPLTKTETKEEKLKGGLADKKTFNDLVKKHSKIKNIEEVLKDQLRKGIKVELEHTDDRKVAKEIAMDHLYEDPKYYDKLKKVEAKEATSSSSSGQYSGPAFLAKSMKKKDWRGASKTQIPGGKFVEVKKKCKTFPYCNQGDIKALRIFENETLSRVISKISKEHNISEILIKNIIIEELRKNR